MATKTSNFGMNLKQSTIKKTGNMTIEEIINNASTDIETILIEALKEVYMIGVQSGWDAMKRNENND